MFEQATSLASMTNELYMKNGVWAGHVTLNFWPLNAIANKVK